MATLALNKAKLIGETPLQDISNKFVVMRQARQKRSFRFACYHDTKEKALQEAGRLAKNSKGERFLVLSILAYAEGGLA